MRKLIFILHSILISIVFLSCRTVLQYPNTAPRNIDETNKSIISGYFVSEESNQHDIVIQGYLSSFNLGTFFPASSNPSTLEKYTWSGNIIIDHKEQPVTIGVFVNRSSNNRNDVQQMNPVSIKKLPKEFEMNNFGITRGITLFKSNHAVLTEFRIEKRLFSLSLNEKAVYDELSQIISQNARLHILDSTGKIIADFDKISYRIYETDPPVTLVHLQMAVAVFSIVQHIASEL